MPESLLASQFDTLERLAPDERGLVVDVGQGIDAIVEEYVATCGPRAARPSA
jgi:gluconokinase